MQAAHASTPMHALAVRGRRLRRTQHQPRLHRTMTRRPATHALPLQDPLSACLASYSADPAVGVIEANGEQTVSLTLQTNRLGRIQVDLPPCRPPRAMTGPNMAAGPLECGALRLCASSVPPHAPLCGQHSRMSSLAGARGHQGAGQQG